MNEAGVPGEYLQGSAAKFESNPEGKSTPGEALENMSELKAYMDNVHEGQGTR